MKGKFLARLFYPLLFLSASLFLVQCQSNSTTDTPGSGAGFNPGTEPFDSILSDLENHHELMKSDLLSPALIDSAYFFGTSETMFADTTVQLNDSLLYSIIDLSDTVSICSHSFIITLNRKSQRVIAAQYLKPDCDVDYSQPEFDLYDYTIPAKDTVCMLKETFFQKKDHTSTGQDEDIDHKEIETEYFIISPTGQIRTFKK